MSVCHVAPTLTALREDFLLYLRRAYEQAGCPAALDALQHCHVLLDAMALTTTEYALLRNRLHNAQRYSLQAERGAARFELSLLLRSVAVAA
jgi:hypothetical protein